MSAKTRIDRLTTAMLKGMTDTQLDAVIGGSQTDYAQFTDSELTAIIHNTVSPELCQRFEGETP